jgi:hypothetical protein
MKRILCLLLVAALPFGSVLADAPKSKNVKVTLVYQHELPNVPGKSIKGVLVEYGPGGSEAVIADALDATAVKAAVGQIRPDAVINELTSLPRHYTPAEMEAAAEHDREIRVEGNINLLAAN